MKQIHLRKKNTGAKTQYYAFYSKSEKDWLIGTLAFYLPAAIEKACSNPRLFNELNTPNKAYGKYQDPPNSGNWKYNSALRFWSGFLNNHFENADLDISQPQLDSVATLMQTIDEPVEWVFNPPASNILDISSLLK